jgi:hypothetical protein
LLDLLLFCFFQDLAFVSVMVQTLNLILLTSSELFEFRSLLKQSLLTDEGRDRFISLYKSWYAHSHILHSPTPASIIACHYSLTLFVYSSSSSLSSGATTQWRRSASA